MSQKKRPCFCCGEDLNLWGDRRGDCPNCAKAKRETIILCAGRCGKSYQMGHMEAVNVVINPSKKGGKTFKVYYCSSCCSFARSRASTLSSNQKKEIAKTEQRLKSGRSKNRKERV